MLKKIVLFLLIGVNVFCSDAVSKIINTQELLDYYKGKTGIYKWGSVKNEGANSYKSNVDIEIKIDSKNVLFIEKSDNEIKELVYDTNFNVLKKELKTIGREGNFDKIIYETYNNKIYMTKFKNGKNIEKKEKDNKNIFDSDPIIFEYLFSKGCKVFNGDILTPEGKYNMEYKLIETTNLENIGKNYTFPDEFKQNIDIKKEYKVYVGGMTGIIANFYPHKWYYIIENGNVIGFFGGNPKEEAEFEYKING